MRATPPRPVASDADERTAAGPHGDRLCPRDARGLRYDTDQRWESDERDGIDFLLAACGWPRANAARPRVIAAADGHPRRFSIRADCGDGGVRDGDRRARRLAAAPAAQPARATAAGGRNRQSQGELATASRSAAAGVHSATGLVAEFCRFGSPLRRRLPAAPAAFSPCSAPLCQQLAIPSSRKSFS